MNIDQILGRGILQTEFKDSTYSYTGTKDFKESSPEVLKMESKAPTPRPRTKASQNNSYT